MIYELAHYINNHFAFIWRAIECINAQLFVFLYHKKTEGILSILETYDGVEIMKLSDVDKLVSFFERQPARAFEFFNPHKFDEKTLTKLVKNPSFLMFHVNDGDEIVGYFFLRSFFMGKCYLGKMVDARAQGKGIGKKMCCCAMDIASSIGLRMYETISKDNPASLYSTQKVLNTRIVRELDNNYLYIEDISKKTDNDVA